MCFSYADMNNVHRVFVITVFNILVDEFWEHDVFYLLINDIVQNILLLFSHSAHIKLTRHHITQI